MLLRFAIGAALRRVRLDRGLTLRVLSERSRVSMPYLSEIERGRKEPSSEILAEICRVLGLTLVDLLREVSTEAVAVDLSARREVRLQIVDASASTHPASGRPEVALVA